MNDLEYNLLRLIDSGALTSAADLEEQENTACMFLQSQGWIFLSLDDSIQGLTPEGRIALYQESKAREKAAALAEIEDELEKQNEKEKAKKEASEEKAIRRSWLQFWLGLFIGWILGGITPFEFIREIARVIGLE